MASGSSTVDIRVLRSQDRVVIDIADHGEGIFAHLRRELGVESTLEAAQRLTLGKVTTMPERHTGEGIFFSSRAVQVFTLEANELRWTADNERDDWALGEVAPRRGTLVRVEVDAVRAAPPAEVFRRYTDDADLAFSTTETVIKLFEFGTRFVSRSEAKRITAGLEPFRRVIVDFAGVDEVGQGFVDELFRVWTADNPDKAVEPRNMNDAVRFMVERGRPRP